MTRLRARSLPIRNAFSALVLFTPLFIGRVALAQEACGDTTCPKGFSCEAEPGSCPTIDCAEGPCEPCVARTEFVCRPGPCAADADCAEGMACADVQQTNCADAADAAPCLEGSCPETRPEGTCSTTTVKQCLPRWALACSADADCGGGFSCKEQQRCSCPGSPGSSGSGSGAADPELPTPTPSESKPAEPPPADCTCEPSGQKACEAIPVACTSDVGCPSGWSCRDNPEGACWADSNGNTGCTPVDPAKLCVPPYSDLGGDGFGTSNDGAELPTAVKGSAESDNPGGTTAGGGCSIGSTSSGASRDAFAWCLALGAALGLSRRVRRARVS